MIASHFNMLGGQTAEAMTSKCCGVKNLLGGFGRQTPQADDEMLKG
jgi:hypothetical protein